jgi:hypothetical protein
VVAGVVANREAEARVEAAESSHEPPLAFESFSLVARAASASIVMLPPSLYVRVTRWLRYVKPRSTTWTFTWKLFAFRSRTHH